MLIHYASNKLKNSMATATGIKKNYGTRAKQVSQRKSDLEAATTLDQMKYIPQSNCHALVGNRKGQFAVDISANHRIIFEPFHDPLPFKADGSLDWEKITEITIVAVGEDYH